LTHGRLSWLTHRGLSRLTHGGLSRLTHGGRCRLPRGRGPCRHLPSASTTFDRSPDWGRHARDLVPPERRQRRGDASRHGPDV